MLGWFFHNFEQSIKALLGNHVGFIENEDFVAISGRSKHRSLPQVSGIIHTVVAGRINFDYIQGTTTIAS